MPFACMWFPMEPAMLIIRLFCGSMPVRAVNQLTPSDQNTGLT